MNPDDILNGDLIAVKRGPNDTWLDPNFDGPEIELVVVGGPYASGRITAVCQDDQVEESFDLDDDYIKNNHVNSKWLGYSACILPVKKINRIVHKPKSVGDSINVSCSIHNKIICQINQPNKGNCVKQFEIIGKVFNKSAWQYEYAIKIPYGSTAGIILSDSDLECYGIRDTSLIGSPFQGVLTSEIMMVEVPSPPRGLNCMNRYCRAFCPWVDDPNCPNGVFLCYSCKSNPTTYEIVMSEFSSTDKG